MYICIRIVLNPVYIYSLISYIYIPILTLCMLWYCVYMWSYIYIYTYHIYIYIITSFNICWAARSSPCLWSHSKVVPRQRRSECRPSPAESGAALEENGEKSSGSIDHPTKKMEYGYLFRIYYVGIYVRCFEVTDSYRLTGLLLISSCEIR